jgi:hypothetical protein
MNGSATTLPPLGSDGLKDNAASESKEAEMVRLREAIRTTERRERAALTELRRFQDTVANTELLAEQLRLEKAAGERLQGVAQRSATLERRMETLCSLLQAWDEEVCRQLPPLNPSAARDTAEDASVYSALTHAAVLPTAPSAAPSFGTSNSAEVDFSAALKRARARLRLCQSRLTCQQEAQQAALRRAQEAVGLLQASEGMNRALQDRLAMGRRKQIELEQTAADAAGRALKYERLAAATERESQCLRSVVASFDQENSRFLRTQPDELGSANVATAAMEAEVCALQEKTASLQETAAEALDATSKATADAAVLRLRLAAAEAEVSCLTQEREAIYTALSPRIAADANAACLDGRADPRASGDAGPLHVPAGFDAARETAEQGVDTQSAVRAVQGAHTAGEVPASTRSVGGGSEEPGYASSNLVSGRGLRVLHMAVNPSSTVAREQGMRLRALVEAQRELIAKLQEMVSTAAAARTTTPAALAAAPTTVVGSLGTSLASTAASADLEKLRQRMKDVFRKQIERLRETVYRLTGWKIDMTIHSGKGDDSSRTSIVLRHLFAESDDHYLQFELSGDDLSMLETPFTALLRARSSGTRCPLMYLSMYKSFPAFLSDLTLDLFDKQTVTASL